MSLLLNPRDLDFNLYELLDTEALLRTPRYAEHDRAVFDAVIEAARVLAEEKFAPFAAKLDANEPTFDGERVHCIPELQEALDALVAGGFMGIAAEAEDGEKALEHMTTAVEKYKIGHYMWDVADAHLKYSPRACSTTTFQLRGAPMLRGCRR